MLSHPRVIAKESKSEDISSLVLNFREQYSDAATARNEIDVMCEKVRATSLPEIEIRGYLKRFALQTTLKIASQNRNISTWYFDRCKLEEKNEYGIDAFSNEIISAAKKHPTLVLKWRFFSCEWNNLYHRPPDPFININKSALALTKNNRRLHLSDAYLSNGLITGSDFNFAKEHFEYVTLFN